MLSRAVLDELTFPQASLEISQIMAFAPIFILAALLVLGIYVMRAVVSRSIEDSYQRYRLRKFVTYVGALLIVLLLLSTISTRVAQLSVVIGAVAAATVFALQEVIASLAGWVALSFGGFYKPGDRVELGGIKGDVIDVGLLRTTLMEVGAWVDGDQYSGRMVRIANSFVFKEPVFNYSAEFPFLWEEFKLPIRYGSDMRLAEELILAAVRHEVESFTAHSRSRWQAIARKFLIEEASLDPTVIILATDNWAEFTVRYIVDYKLRRSTRTAIMRSVLAAIEQSGGAVRLGSATTEIVGIPKIEITGSS